MEDDREPGSGLSALVPTFGEEFQGRVQVVGRYRRAPRPNRDLWINVTRGCVCGGIHHMLCSCRLGTLVPRTEKEIAFEGKNLTFRILLNFWRFGRMVNSSCLLRILEQTKV